jgi:hypothetical protein
MHLPSDSRFRLLERSFWRKRKHGYVRLPLFSKDEQRQWISDGEHPQRGSYNGRVQRFNS